MIVAPVRYFQIGVVQRRGEHAPLFALAPLPHGVDARIFAVRACERIEQRLRIVAAEKDVRLRERGKEFADILFGQAAGYDDLFEVSAAVRIAVENGIDGLFAGRLQKRAGIDDEDVRLGNVVRDRISLFAQDAEQTLGVHAVFIAPQRDHAEFFVFQHFYSP